MRLSGRRTVQLIKCIFFWTKLASRWHHPCIQPIQWLLRLAISEMHRDPAKRGVRGNKIAWSPRNSRSIRMIEVNSARLPRLWNKLPVDIFHAPTTDTFKQLPDGHCLASTAHQSPLPAIQRMTSTCLYALGRAIDLCQKQFMWFICFDSWPSRSWPNC